jgi:SagB-type dehydrogenase family enzyme
MTDLANPDYSSAIDNEVLVLSPLCRIERDNNTPRKLRIFSGEGSRRNKLEVSGDLLDWLLSLVEPVDVPTLLARTADRLGIGTSQARELVTMLTDAGVIVSESFAVETRSRGQHWEEWGWRDAFDFHFASRSLEFENLDADDFRAAVASFDDSGPDIGPQPGPYKIVPGERIDLPKPTETARWVSLGDALSTNWPVETFRRRGISIDTLSTVLWYGFGAQSEIPTIMGPHICKTSPSGGARHPVEAYVIVRDVESVPEGIYHFAPTGALRLINDPSAIKNVDEACFGKPGIVTASAVIIATVRWGRHNWKYRYSRSYRMALIDLGHVVQTVALAGALADTRIYSTYAVDDCSMASLLKLEDACTESPLMAFGLGIGGCR